MTGRPTPPRDIVDVLRTRSAKRLALGMACLMCAHLAYAKIAMYDWDHPDQRATVLILVVTGAVTTMVGGYRTLAALYAAYRFARDATATPDSAGRTGPERPRPRQARATLTTCSGASPRRHAASTTEGAPSEQDRLLGPSPAQDPTARRDPA